MFKTKFSVFTFLGKIWFAFIPKEEYDITSENSQILIGDECV